MRIIDIIKALLGNAEGQFNLGYSYHQLGLYEKSFKWWKKSAEKGLKESQYCLGLLYLNGDGVNKDRKQASYWFQKANDQGFGEIQGSFKDYLDKKYIKFKI